MPNSSELSKPRPTSVLAGNARAVLLSIFCTRWLVMPMSPRRYQPPNSSTGGAYCGAYGRSAASAMDDSSDAAPAAIKNFTQRIGFVLLSGEAATQGLTFETHRWTMPPNA